MRGIVPLNFKPLLTTFNMPPILFNHALLVVAVI